MMRTNVVPLLLAAMLLALLGGPGAAAPAVDQSASSGIIGGYRVELNSSATSLTAGGYIDDAPALVEVYTASWCENCVPAEHALDDAIANHSREVTQLYFHRYIGESQDPFGTLQGDERWESRYGEASVSVAGIMRAPPTMVFGGSHVRAGSVPEGESLQEDYAGLLNDVHDYSRVHVHSGFTWTPSNNSSGVIDWNMDMSSQWTGVTWTHRAFVVEQSVYFPEGSNGLDYYHYVVRGVYTLAGPGANNQTDGQKQIDLPQAWDGDDLSIVLVHEWEAPPEEVEPNNTEDGLLPATGFAMVLAAFALALVERYRRL